MATKRPPELIRRAVRDLRKHSESDWTPYHLAKVLCVHLSSIYRYRNDLDDAIDLTRTFDD